MFKNMVEKVAVSVGTALALGVLALLWNFASSGGLVKVLGGVPIAEWEAFKAHAHSTPPAPSAALPKNVVVVFDSPDGCPESWAPFEEGFSRVLIGAYDSRGNWENRTDPRVALTQHKYRGHGGIETVALSVAQMPKHAHDYKDVFHSESESHIKYWVKPLPTGLGFTPVPGDLGTKGDFDRDNQGLQLASTTDQSGSSAPHDNMPPYLALYFCKKL